MSPIGHHIRTRLVDDRVIAPSAAEQRRVTRIVLKQGRRDRLLVTSLAGNHLHLDALCDAAQASRLIQRITSSVRQKLGLPVGFTHYPHEPIRDNRHLWYSTRYILTQQRRHGLPPEQPLEGTNLPDLLGLRLVGDYTRTNLRRWLPQLSNRQLVKWLGVEDLHPVEGPLDGLLEATLAAAALDDLESSSSRVIAARRAAVEVVGNRIRHPDLAELLHIRPRTLTWLRRRPVDRALVRAIRLQLGVRAQLRERGAQWRSGEVG